MENFWGGLKSALPRDITSLPLVYVGVSSWVPTSDDYCLGLGFRRSTIGMFHSTFKEFER